MDRTALPRLIGALGPVRWRRRLDALRAAAAAPTQLGRAAAQHHVIELTIDRLHQDPPPRPLSPAEQRILAGATHLAQLPEELSPAGRSGLQVLLEQGLSGEASLAPLFHLLRTARMQQRRGFRVSFAGLEHGAPFDLLIARDGTEAEVACDALSAEHGRDVHRGAFLSLIDGAAGPFAAWLRARPGRVLLKLTLPLGLRQTDPLAHALPERMARLLAGGGRADADEAAVLRLEPLTLAAASADQAGLMPRLRAEFGPEAHLAVTAAPPNGLFVTAARAGRPNDVAGAVRRRLETVAPARLTGTRPGIVSVFLEDTDRTEWRLLRDSLALEGEVRRFLTRPEARRVVAVTCASRLELFGLPEPDSAPGGELRFRNQAHPAAKNPALAPSVLSSV